MTWKGAAMFDDIPGFLDGTGPTTTVLDSDNTPNNILNATLGGFVVVDWQFAGSLSAILGDVEFTVTLVADPVSVDPKLVLGTTSVIDASGNYSVTFTIAPNSLNPDAYRLTVVITSIEFSSGGSLPIAGFLDGPIIQVRPGP
jgi:hypothetical protein